MPDTFEQGAVVGVTAWGTTLAVHLARLGHAVTLVPRRAEHAAAGFAAIREADAGRCGFLIAEGAVTSVGSSLMESAPPEGVISLSSVLRVHGEHAEVIRHAIGDKEQQAEAIPAERNRRGRQGAGRAADKRNGCRVDPAPG